MNRNCSVCNIKIDKNNYLKDRPVCKSCYINNGRKNNNNIIDNNSKSKVNNQKAIIPMTMIKKKENLVTL